MTNKVVYKEEEEEEVVYKDFYLTPGARRHLFGLKTGIENMGEVKVCYAMGSFL